MRLPCWDAEIENNEVVGEATTVGLSLLTFWIVPRTLATEFSTRETYYLFLDNSFSFNKLLAILYQIFR